MEKVIIVLDGFYEIEIDESVKIGEIKFRKNSHNSLYDFVKEKTFNRQTNKPIEVITLKSTYCFSKEHLTSVKGLSRKVCKLFLNVIYC